MTSKELVAAALAGRPTPRVPSGPLAVHFCARVAGHSLLHYSSDPHALAQSVIRYYERFKPDAIWVSADTWVSAEAMGARVAAVEDNQPFGGVGLPLVRTAIDIERIPPPDIDAQGRYPLMLKALGEVVAALGHEVFVVACFDQYPFSLAAALMGINEIMVRAVDDPPFVEALMERCLEYGLAYGRAMGRAGADMLSGGDSPAGLLGPDLYRKCALPYEQRLLGALRDPSGPPVSLHICGKTQRLLPLMKQSGADVVEVDHFVDLEKTCRVVGPEIAVWGNLDPVAVLARGTPEEVTRAAQDAVVAVQAAGHRRFVLSSGCTLAMETPDANLNALLQAARVARPQF